MHWHALRYRSLKRLLQRKCGPIVSNFFPGKLIFLLVSFATVSEQHRLHTQLTTHPIDTTDTKKKCFTISNACPSLLHIKDILTYAYSKKSADTNITGENGVGLMQAIPALARGALILTINSQDTIQIGVLPDSPEMGEPM